MEVNETKLDELYLEWCGVHHTINSNKLVHDSSACTDFARFCLKYAMSALAENNPTSEEQLAAPAVSPRLFYLVEEIEEGVLQNITIGLSTYEKAKDYQERWKHRHPNAFILAYLNGG